MLQFSPAVRIFICLGPVDFRKGIDGLSGVCRNKLLQNPLSGVVFVFRNKRKTTLKLLFYDGQGFWLCSKRLSQGTFQWWPDGNEVDTRELQTLLWNGNPQLAQFGKDWKKVKR
jgi:transposase